MIYKLDTDFSKIEQADGLMQNLSHQAYVEVVSCVEDPRKDSGIILLPLEKINFKAKKGESVFARSAHIGGALANISVVNFNMPASDGSGAGGTVGSILYSHIVLPGWIKADGALISRSEYPELFTFANENNLLLSEVDWLNGMQGMYGKGDGMNTFRLPDLRGEFLRALDDGRGLDAGRTLGSKQRGSLICFDWDTKTSEIAGVGSERGLHGDVGFDVLGTNEYPNAKCCWISGTTIQSPLREEAIGVSRPHNIALIAQIKY